MRDALDVVTGAGDLLALVVPGADRSRARRAGRRADHARRQRRHHHDHVRAQTSSRQECADHGAAERRRARTPRPRPTRSYPERRRRAHEPGASPSSTHGAPRTRRRWRRLAQVADHVEHARDVAGVEHIGLGGDFDGTDRLPVGLEDVVRLPDAAHRAGRPRLVRRRAGRADAAATSCASSPTPRRSPSPDDRMGTSRTVRSMWCPPVAEPPAGVRRSRRYLRF